MTFKNNNTEIVNKIINRSIKANKTRNIFVLISVILTTFMISAVFNMSYSVVRNTDIMEARIMGVSADILLNMPTDEQIEYIKNTKDVETVGLMLVSGTVKSEKLDEINKHVDLFYYDMEGFENQIAPIISDIEGAYPTEYNEIMLSTKSMEYLGLEGYEIGDTIQLVVENYDKSVDEETFVISGIYYDYSESAKGLVSEQYVLGKNQTVESSGSVMVSVKFLKEDGVVNDLSTNLMLNQRQSLKSIFFSPENYIDIIIVAIVFVIFLMFTGFLLTYNVVQISVNKDINFYGLLKTIGMSPTQIKKVVTSQVVRLSVIGIPVGLLLSYLVCLGMYGYFSVLLYAKDRTAMPMTVSVNVYIIIFAIVFSLITIYVSCRKPAKMASRVSPVEAVRYTGIEDNYKRKSRKTTNGGKLYKMAWYNVFRNGKRSIVVFVSLFMGVITFLSAVTVTSSLNLENYIELYYPYDVEMSYNYGTPEDVDFYTDDKIREIENMDSVSDLLITKKGLVQIELDDEIIMLMVRRNLMFGLNDEELDTECNRMKSENNGFAEAKILGINDNAAEMIYNINDEAFDLEAFKRGEVALIRYIYANERITGDIFNNKLEVKSIDNSNEQEFKMISIGNIGPIGGISNQNGVPCIYVSENSLEQLADNVKVQSINFNCDEKAENYFVDMASSNDLYIRLQSEALEDMKQGITVMNVIGSAVGAILILIGVLNFINIIVTNMDSRKMELAFLESIGMTKKQIRKMITYEGLYYAVVTSVLTLTVGTGILAFVGNTMEGQDPYIEYVYPAKEVVIILIFIYIVCLTVPKIVYNKFSKASIVERSK